MANRFEMLGCARIALDDETSQPVQATIRGHALAYLALTGDWVTRDRLGFLFWADTPDTTARHNVRQLLKRIRQLPWIEGLETSDDAVRWLVPSDVADLAECIAREDWDDLPDSGDLLPGLERNSTAEFEEWLLGHRHRTLGMWQTAVVASARHAAAHGDPSVGRHLLEPFLESTSSEVVVVPYMELAVKEGRRDLAVAGFDRVASHLLDELGVDPPAEAVEMARRLAAPSGSSTVESARRGLIGREHELAEITRLLARPDCRLLTLVGAAGIGKSTIAREVVNRSGNSHIDGASFISLENVNDPGDVPASIAAGLSLGLDARADAVDQIVASLADRDMLLVFDNVEHLRPAWGVFSRLVRSCPRIQVLTTSRERLRLDDESIHEVNGLSEDDAIELFVEMGRRIAPGIEVSTEDARAISRVVGASPLGLELAAPWLRVMAASDIADEVQGDQSLLSGGQSDGATRHHSLAATMQHSWELASAIERETVEALSVFAAPYTRELAAEVGGATATVLRDLVDQSLVHRRDDGTYSSHPLVRGYAAAQLAADPPHEREVRRRHAVATLRLVGSTTEAPTRRALVEDALAACQHAMEIEAVDLIIPALDGVTAVLLASGRINRGVQLLADVSNLLTRVAPEQPAWLATVEQARSRLLYAQALYASAAAAAEHALRAATRADDQRMRVRASLSLGWAKKWMDGDPAQYRVVSEALPVAESLGDSGLIAEVLNGMGCSAPTLEQCRAHLRDGLDRADDEALGLRAALLNNLGMVSWALGAGDIAVAHVQAALDIARSVDDHSGTIDGLSSLAFLHSDLGDLATARRLSVDAESVTGDADFLDTRIYALLVAGEIRRLTADSQGAVARGREALEMASAVGNESFALRALRLHGQLLLDGGHVRTGLGILAVVVDRTAATGGDFTSTIVNPRVWDTATADLDTELVESARAWAADRDLDEVIRLVLVNSSDSADVS